MAKYIEKQALLKKMHASYSTPLLMGHTTDEDIMFKTMVSIVEEQPTADVVEVVRCKDCRFKTVTEDGEYNPHDIVCEMHMSDGFNESDYCSYGERSNNNV